MTRVYLTEQGSTGRLRGGRLAVERDGMTLLQAPLETVEQVVVVGTGIQLSTALIAALLRRGVDVSYLTRGGRPIGKMVGDPRAGVELRAGQYRTLLDSAAATAFVRTLVDEKLLGQARHLRERAAGEAAVARIERLRESLPAVSTVDQVRGAEGAGAAAYWQALVPLVPAAWRFRGRRAFPAIDPLNALLSFGYTLLLNVVAGAVQVVGLDPHLGALHPPDGTRPSLALDLMEPLRPLGVDVWVFGAALGGEFLPEQFVEDGGRVLLAADARRRFLARFERAMERRVRHPLEPGRVTLRQAVELHVRAAGQVFAGRRAVMEAITWP